MKKLLACVLLMILTVSSACAETLRVGVYNDVAGFAIYNEEADIWSGMEIDLARKLAKDLNYSEIEFIGLDTSEREPALTSHTVDCVIALFTVTSERSARIHFSKPYFTGGCRVMVAKSTLFTHLRDIVGKNIGVVRDSTAAFALAKAMRRRRLIPAFDENNFAPETFNTGLFFTLYETYDDMVEALELGDNDGICADDNILYSYRNSERLVMLEPINTEQYAVATLPGNPLGDRINELVERYIQDGTISSLVEKWSLMEVALDA